MQPPSPIVECQQVNKRFVMAGQTLHALQDVTLQFTPGTFAMIVGPSGCGKTTLISVIAGMLAPDSGTCWLQGNDIYRMNPHAIEQFRATQLGFIFQSFNLIRTLTVQENCALPLIIKNMPRDQAFMKAEEILRRVGIERPEATIGQLSGGQQQRVAIARALIHQPAIVICDEPTSALDHDTGQHIMELMKHMNIEMGTTFIVVTHDNRIFEYATQIIHMDDGRIIKTETRT